MKTLNGALVTLETFESDRHRPSTFLAAWLEEQRLEPETRREIEHYYASYGRSFNAYMRHCYDRRLEPLLAVASPGNRVLEVGSGLGTESLFLACKNCDVVGLELSEKRLTVAEERLALLRALRPDLAVSCRFVLSSLFDDDLDEKLGGGFDLIWLEETFHHLEPRAKVGGRLSQLLRSGGRLVIAETNAWHPLVQLSLLRTRGLPKVRKIKASDGRQHLYGVERITTAGSVARLFEQNGLVTETLCHERLYPNLGIAPNLLIASERWLSFLPRFSYVHYCYVGRKPQ